VQVDSINFMCTTGVINATHPVPEIGLISTNNDQFNFCLNDAPDFVRECDSFYNFDALHADFAE